MGKDTAIAWTDHTWNPWQGCHRVSAGCANCYMFAEKKRYGQDPATVVRSRAPTFDAPLSKKWATPALVFTCSWSDFFIEEADAWRPEAWGIIRSTPHLTYQILTKRPERMAACLPPDWGAGYPNVWLGVTAENQAAADERIPYLIETPAAVRFLSCEPLLGPLDLFAEPAEALMWRKPGPDGRDAGPSIGWVIVGGESGPRARPCAEEWIRSIIQQCRAVKVPVFCKQLGAYVVSEHRTAPAEAMEHPERITAADRAPFGEVWAWRAGLKDRKGSDMSEWPADLQVRELPTLTPGGTP